MSIQKLYRNGNSVAVTIPKEILKNMGLKEGSEVLIEPAPDDDGVVVRKISSNKKLPSSLTPEFKNWLDEVGSKYSNIIKELAKK